MSRVALDVESQQYRVFLPQVKRLPPNPHIYASGRDAVWDRAMGAPSETECTDSEAIPEPKEQKNLRYNLLCCDQLSFLTGSAVPDLQAAYILNAIRRNSMRKLSVENLLAQQRLQHLSMSKFSLDHVQNAILSEADAAAMLEALRVSNNKWQQYRPSLGPIRPLDVSKAPFNDPKCDVMWTQMQRDRRRYEYMVK